MMILCRFTRSLEKTGRYNRQEVALLSETTLKTLRAAKVRLSGEEELISAGDVSV